MPPEIIPDNTEQIHSCPLVSIIVPAYNAEDFLDECLASISNQTYGNYEVLIVDDGSTDETSRIAMKYVANNDRFQLLRQSNKGVSAARNLALDVLTGDYVMFVDSDDWIEPNCIETLVAAAIGHDVDIVVMEYVEFTYPDGTEERISLSDYANRTFPELIADDDTLYGGFAWNKMIRRSYIKNNYHEDFYYYENLVFFLENTDSTTRYYLVHKQLYHYRIHLKSAVHSKQWNPRKLSTLKALIRAMELAPSRLVPFYEYLYINRVLWIKITSKRAQMPIDLDSETKLSKQYCTDVVRSSDIDLIHKIKAIVICYFPYFYGIYLRKPV